jgi:hypothetical protein
MKGWAFLLLSLILILPGCVAQDTIQAGAAADKSARPDADKLLPVDCLLPSQIRSLGTSMTYLAPRRATKTTALDCEIRGGEYVAYDRADYRTSLNIWLESAKAGDAEAQTYVGEIFEKGLGLPVDYKTAITWYQKAAQQGYARAQINLGYLYEKGLGVEKDMLKALNWYRRASGVEGDQLDYTSSIEAKASSLAQEETIILRQEIKRREQHISQLNASLKTTRQKMIQGERQLNDAQKQLQVLEQQKQTVSDAAALESARASIAEQKLKIVNAETTLANLNSKISQDEQFANQQANYVIEQKQTLASIKPIGPSIEIFDPPVFITRNGEPTVRMRSGNSTRVISGKIEAPAGLRKAMFNSQSLSTDSSGNFHSAVAVSGQPEKVLIEAEDILGARAEFSFNLVPVGEANQQAIIDENRLGRVAQGIDFGRYFALVIGNNEYKHYPALKTAVNDARVIAGILERKYGFDTRLITNADRYTILSALNEVKDKMSPSDNLLVYFAGHGERDAKSLQGYWLPVDAELVNTANWIPNAAISGLLNTLDARHILVIADSCYSGLMTRSSVARLDAQLNDNQLEKWLKVMSKTKSRTVLTSGGLQPVLDSGGGQHSVFAGFLINELSNARSPIDAYKIYLDVSQKVQQKSVELGFEQVPTYAPIQHTGHSGGEFVFVKG